MDHNQWYFLIATIDMFVFLFCPLFFMTIYLLNLRKTDASYVVFFITFYKKFKKIDHKKYVVNFIYKDAWELVKDKLLLCQKYFIVIVRVYSFFLFLLLLKIIFSPNINVFNIWGDYIDKEQAINLSWIIMTAIEIFIICSLTFFMKMGLYVPKRKINEVDEFVNNLNFATDSLCFDECYISNNKENNIILNNDQIKLLLKGQTTHWNSDFNQKQISFLLSYFMLWGDHLITKDKETQKYKETYKNFVNYFDTEIKMFGIENKQENYQTTQKDNNLG